MQLILGLAIVAFFTIGPIVFPMLLELALDFGFNLFDKESR